MAVTTNFSFTKLVGTDYAGYSTINVLIDSIDTLLNVRIPSTGGPASAAPVSTATNLTVATTSKSIICTAVAVLTLPAAATYTGRELLIKNTTAATVTSASSNVVPLSGAQTASTAILAATAGKWALLVSNGTNWVIMASN